MKTNHAPIEKDYMAHNECRLLVDHDTAEYRSRTVFGLQTPVIAPALRGKEKTAIEIVNMKEISFVSHKRVILELFDEWLCDSCSFVFLEQTEETVFAPLQMGLLSLQQSILQRTKGHQTKDEKPCQNH